ncbi:SUMF1/EgtB/PvdO family nonheme iron enzyme [Hyphomonas sp.]|uniref:SUMF1/EgtB/PvdO family nonheme iron enzyme n=1 Tax=Hyphomonas sp. TaxID=87 RepID=UPI00391D9195
MVDVFISYARRQRHIAEPLKDRLVALGLDVFFDIEGIDGGSVFPDVITRALDSSKAVLTCWSPLYFTRPWCLTEAREGKARDVLVPVIIEAFDRTAPPADLRHVNYYDLTAWQGEDTHENWNLTLQRLSRLVGRKLAPQLMTGPSGDARITQPAPEPPPAASARIDVLADLRATWGTFPARGNADSVARFLQRVQGAASGSGLEFEVEHHLDELRRVAEAEKNAAGETAARAAEASRRQKPGTEFRDGEGLPLMVTLPQGSFRMGSPDTEKDRQANEGPVHDVRIGYALAVGKYPVTVGEFRRFIEAKGHDTGNSAFTWGVGAGWHNTIGRGWSRPGFVQDDSHPVTCVSWQDAQAYVAWAAEQVALPYRLMSEAEWEFACRAGTNTRYAFGDNLAVDIANFGKSNGGTTRVSSFSSNAFGLCDMHGNVWEWTQDCAYSSHAGAPSDGSARTNGEGTARIVRGGSWNSYPELLRSAYRKWEDSTTRSYNIGFRVARTF